MLESSVVLFCSSLNLLLSDLLMGDTETLDVHDLWNCGTPGKTLIGGFEYTKITLNI